MEGVENKDIEGLLASVLTEGEGADYLEITNFAGQRWYIPFSHIRTGLSLYRPGKMRGKLVKLLLPVMKYLTLFLSKIGVRKVKLRMSSDFRDLLRKTFNEPDVILAVFCGTPGVHQKITVQVSCGKKVLGYCKISGREAVKELFVKESALLGNLRMKGVGCVPEILFCGEPFPGIFVFIQDTAEKDRSLRGCRDERLVWDFLGELNAKTSSDVPFMESGYYRDLQSLKAAIGEYGAGESDLLERAIAEVEDYFLRCPVRFSVYHGDLTPWNAFVHHGKLYVFDWEYSKSGYPPFLDFFHFFTQSAFFERHWNAGRTCREFESMKDTVMKYVPDPNMYYRAYLLSIIQFHMDRERGGFDPLMRSRYEFWVRVLIALNEY